MGQGVNERSKRLPCNDSETAREHGIIFWVAMRRILDFVRDGEYSFLHHPVLFLFRGHFSSLLWYSYITRESWNSNVRCELKLVYRKEAPRVRQTVDSSMLALVLPYHWMVLLRIMSIWMLESSLTSHPPSNAFRNLNEANLKWGRSISSSTRLRLQPKLRFNGDGTLVFSIVAGF